MGLKDNIDAVKKEIGTEEKFLESVIKSERFFKKYKKYIITAVVALIVGGSTYAVMSTIKANRLEASNEAYLQLIENPKDTKALKKLKENNERLYTFFQFEQAIKSDDKKTLEELAKNTKDPVLSDLAAYQIGSQEKKSKLLSGFEVLQEGYALLKEGKTKEARLKFAQIDLNSPLQNIVKNLEHYQGSK